MRKSLILTLFFLLPLPVLSQSVTIAEPFKVGTFEIDGAPTVGIVLRDSLIVELDAANLALERDSSYPQIPFESEVGFVFFLPGFGQRRVLPYPRVAGTAILRFDGRRIEYSAISFESLPDAAPVRQRGGGGDRALATEQ